MSVIKLYNNPNDTLVTCLEAAGHTVLIGDQQSAAEPDIVVLLTRCRERYVLTLFPGPAFTKDAEETAPLASYSADLDPPRLADLILSILPDKNSIIDQKLQHFMEQEERLQGELQLASELQKSLLPTISEMSLPLSVAYRYMPVQTIGGDLFDIIPLSETKTGLFITDVSGHGISAAFLTGIGKAKLSQYARNQDHPEKVLEQLNRYLCNTIQTGHFLTAFYAVLDTAAETCTFASAGHPKQLIIHADTSVAQMTAPGFFLGMFEDTEYVSKTVPFASGDKIILYTDGLIESENRDGSLFSRDHLISTLQEHTYLDPEETCDLILNTLMNHLGDTISMKDDLTILVAKNLENL